MIFSAPLPTMPALRRYAAFLRGVTPMNAKMAELKRAFEAGGFSDVRTLLSSGNVVFSAPAATIAALQGQAEAAMQQHLGRTFTTFVRPVDDLRALLDGDPYKSFRLAIGAKRVVTFLRQAAPAKVRLPPALEGARILCVRGSEAFSAYVRGASSPVFMTLIEKTFGRDVTTRTWETVRKAAGAVR